MAFEIPELMKKIRVYGHWEVQNEFKKNKFGQCVIKCKCIGCGIIKWKLKSLILEERNCRKCLHKNRKRNFFRLKSHRENPIGKKYNGFRANTYS